MKLGEIQTLTVVKAVDFGIYLAEMPTDKETVLLPAKQVPEGTGIGDRLEVFLYRDSEDRLIATTHTPKITVGGLAPLTVAGVTKIGAFLDWGLEKDLFLPYKEQLRKVEKGDEILVTMYIDKSDRLCASMRGLYSLLDTDSPYRTGDQVKGRIYEFSKNFGTFVAVDDRYSARIPLHEDTSSLRIGDVITASVRAVKADGKLDLTTRDKAYLQIAADAENIQKLLEHYGGELPFNDKASPKLIQQEAHMSKKAFKRAVGHLYKERRIEITETGIRSLTDSGTE